VRNNVLSLVFIVAVAVAGLAATIATDSSPELGLDLQGGASVVLQPPEGVDDSGVIDQAIEVIRNRVDALGVAEPEIARQGDAVIVELPGVRDQRRALDLVGQTAELRFRPVLADLPPPGEPAPTTTTTAPGDTTTTTAAPGDATTTTAAGDAGATTTTAAGDTTTTTAPGATTTTTAPASSACEPTPREEAKADREIIALGKEVDGEQACYQLGPSQVEGTAVDDASARIQDLGGTWSVDLEFTGEGGRAFDDAAALCNPPGEQCPTGRLAIELDGIVQSAPTIQQADFGGRAQITGDFSEGEAKDLALVLRYGSLPVQLEPQTVQTVSATLGKDSLRAGILAGAIGTALVMAYMLLYYRALGIVVFLGLVIWSALQWAVICWLGATSGLALSLAGVTGIIVSIGVTVDSYVVFFERLKDEVRTGRTVRASVDRSFKRAFRTMLVADTSAFMGAAVLYLLTVGPVRGFAFFLGLSTVLDVVVTWFFMRPLTVLISRNKVFTSNRFFGVARGVGAPAAATS
jgi:preprotein translocase subunit SecD